MNKRDDYSNYEWSDNKLYLVFWTLLCVIDAIKVYLWDESCIFEKTYFIICIWNHER